MIPTRSLARCEQVTKEADCGDRVDRCHSETWEKNMTRSSARCGVVVTWRVPCTLPLFSLDVGMCRLAGVEPLLVTFPRIRWTDTKGPKLDKVKGNEAKEMVS